MPELRDRYEVAVIGAGLAGSTVAHLLARRGRDVVLFERDAFPRDKLCGEFLSPESQAILEELGVLDSVADGAPSITRARFSAPSGAQLDISLPGEALGVSRLRLDQTLFRAAQRAGASTFDQCPVRDIETGDQVTLTVSRSGSRQRVRSDIAICAYGRRTRLDRAQDRPFMFGRHPYVGFKRHHRPREGSGGRLVDRQLRDHVEIHGFEGGYCGMSHIETGEINVCMLLEQRFVDGLEEAKWPRIAERIGSANQRLGERLAALEPSEDGMHAVAQVPFDLKEVFDERRFYCGDAAGMIAPLAGDGQAMALESARMLADILSGDFGHSIEAAGRRWRRRWNWRYQARLRLSRRLQWLLFREAPLEVGIRTIAAVPGLADALARWTRSVD